VVIAALMIAEAAEIARKNITHQRSLRSRDP
jgi:hypothetical protein